VNGTSTPRSMRRFHDSLLLPVICKSMNCFVQVKDPTSYAMFPKFVMIQPHHHSNGGLLYPCFSLLALPFILSRRDAAEIAESIFFF